MKKRTVFMAMLFSVCLSFSAFAGEWKEDEKGRWYQNDDGSYPQGGWQLIDEVMYHFNSEGYMTASKDSNWEQQEDGKWKYKDEQGYYINKWFTDPKTNYKYHFDTFGNMNTGLCFIDNEWYNFSETGELWFGGQVGENARSTSDDGTVHWFDEPGFFSTVGAVFTSDKIMVGLYLENHKNTPVTVESRCLISDFDAKINERFYHFGDDGVECNVVIPANGKQTMIFTTPDLHAVNFNHGQTMIKVDVSMADGEFWFEIPIYDSNKAESDMQLSTFYFEP